MSCLPSVSLISYPGSNASSCRHYSTKVEITIHVLNGCTSIFHKMILIHNKVQCIVTNDFDYQNQKIIKISSFEFVIHIVVGTLGSLFTDNIFLKMRYVLLDLYGQHFNHSVRKKPLKSLPNISYINVVFNQRTYVRRTLYVHTYKRCMRPMYVRRTYICTYI